LQKVLQKVGCDYRYRAIADQKETTIHVALLSRFPIKRSAEVRVNYSSKDRNILEVLLDVDGFGLTVFVNHWKSKSGPESRRIRYAKALRKRIEKMPNGSEYIILGDFNSNYDEYKQIQKKHNDTSGRTGLNHVLQTIVGDMLVREKEIIHTQNFMHYNLWLELPKYTRWSHNFYGKKEGIDAIIIPYSLFNGEGIDYINNSFSVFKRGYLFHKRGYILRWEYKNGRHKGVGYSDHLAVFAKFSTKAYKEESCTIRLGYIKELFKKNIRLPLKLKNIEVVSQFKNKVYIKDDSIDKTITIFGINREMTVGNFYNIVVYKREFYNGKYEITDFALF